MNLSTEKNLILRVVTAALAIPLVLGLLIWSWYTFLIFCSVLTLAGQYEFFRLLGLNQNKKDQVFTLFPTVLFWLFLFTEPHPDKISGWLLVLVLGMFVIQSLILLFRAEITEPLQKLALLTFSIIYIVMPFALFYRLGFNHTANYEFRIPLGILLLVWCSDTFAYVFGRLMGKHKLMPSVSPSKTIEGAAGGFICTLILSWILQMYWPQFSFHWLEAGILVALMCPLGDLVESRMKRSLDIKDSGGLLPGHGGILDRFDGFLLSVPVFYIWLYLQDRLDIIAL